MRHRLPLASHAHLPRAGFPAALLLAAWLAAPAARAQPAPAPTPSGTAPPSQDASAPATADAEAAPAPAEATPAPEAAPAPAEAAPAPGPIEVTVEGERVPPGSVSLGRRDIRDMPGVLGDPYRIIEVQPGVTPTVSGLPYFFIRGAPPGNVGYSFDGIQVPLLFHIGGGPSVIPPSMVQRVELHLGPYPASYGRVAGAIVGADAAPPSVEWRGEGSLRLGDLAGFAEGPVSEDVTVLVGGRYSIGAFVVSKLVPSVDLGYGDYQARVTYRPGPGERISVLTFGAYDYLASFSEEDGVSQTRVLLDSDFHRIDLRYGRDLESGGELGAAVTLGLDQSRGLGGVERARDWKVNARLHLSRPAGASAVVRGGVDVMIDSYEIIHGEGAGDPLADPTEEQLDEAFTDLFRSRVDASVGAWADARLALDDRSTITPGLRLDYYRSLGEQALAVDPKLVGRFGVGERLRLIPAVGVASQRPGFLPLPALQIAGIPGGLQRSAQASFGAELGLGPVEFGTTVFRQVTFNLTDPIGTGRGTALDAGRFLTRSLGDAYGLELGARGALRRDLLFLASYTLARATRRRDGLTLPSAYDRTHVLHLALLYDLGRGWRAGVRHVFYSGFPADEAGPDRSPSEHPDRVRPFYRFDLRASKRWKLGERGYMALVLDLQNATLSKEVIDVSCGAGGECTPNAIGPVALPGLGLEIGY